MRCVGFPPYYNTDSRVLILGSFPSVKSREVNFYYGNGQNRFWKLLSELLHEPLPTDVDAKKTLLKKHRIALWDMVTECDIVGSMDKDIKDPVIADVPDLLSKIPCEKIFCNGTASYNLLTKNYPDLASITTKLPSTSPANGRFDKKEWEAAFAQAMSP